MSGARRAALQIHGLRKPDRDWVLAQLSEGHRQALLPLLDELAMLGIPPLPMLEGLDAVDSVELVSDSDQEHRQLLAGLMSACPERVAVAVVHECDAVLVALLRLREWPWQGAVLERLAPARREIVATAVRAPGDCVRPAVQWALALALKERLAAVSSEKVVAPVQSRRRRGVLWWLK